MWRIFGLSKLWGWGKKWLVILWHKIQASEEVCRLFIIMGSELPL